LVPPHASLLRVAGLPLDALGIAKGASEITLGTHLLTQSSTQDELSQDQGYDVNSILKASRRLLGVDFK